MSEPRIDPDPAVLHPDELRDMLDREARSWDLREVTDPDGALFEAAHALLAEGFGSDELETAAELRGFLRDDPLRPLESGTRLKYTLILARDASGEPVGVRDAVLLTNPEVAPDLCLVYLARIYVAPRARGTTVSHWLRSAAVEVATTWLGELGRRGLVPLPDPTDRAAHFGMRLDLVAEMAHFAPDDPSSGRRLLWYGRGGFRAVSPRQLPYRQPDLRGPEEVGASAQPLPYLLVARRLGREDEASMPLAEARALLRLLHDDFADWCPPEAVEAAFRPAWDALARLPAGSAVDLLPLPTGPGDLERLGPLAAEGRPVTDAELGSLADLLRKRR